MIFDSVSGTNPLKGFHNSSLIEASKKYASRIIACHIKDFSSPDKDLISHDSQCAIGDGFIDWKSVFEEVKKTSCEVFALEHDDPKDYKDYTIKSLNYLETIA